MLNSSKKQKGRQLEKWVAKRLEAFLDYAYPRSDSGSGVEKKEDVTIPPWVPIHIECKNHAELACQTWYNKAVFSCPKNKYCIVVYKQNYQKVPKVYIKLGDLMGLMSGQTVTIEDYFVHISFDEFEQLLIKSLDFYRIKNDTAINNQ